LQGCEEVLQGRAVETGRGGKKTLPLASLLRNTIALSVVISAAVLTFTILIVKTSAIAISTPAVHAKNTGSATYANSSGYIIRIVLSCYSTIDTTIAATTCSLVIAINIGLASSNIGSAPVAANLLAPVVPPSRPAPLQLLALPTSEPIPPSPTTQRKSYQEGLDLCQQCKKRYQKSITIVGFTILNNPTQKYCFAISISMNCL
jgi:hypothetical protein